MTQVPSKSAEEAMQMYNIEAEQALLGSLLLNNAALEQVSDYLRPEHFADQLHGRIYDATQRLVDRGQIADPITLKDFFDKDKTLEPVGGARYLIDLVNSFTSSSVGDYGRVIHDLFLRRQLIQICHETIQDSRQFKLEVSSTQHIENTEKKLYDLATKGQFSNKPFGLASGFEKVIEQVKTANYRRANNLPSIGISSGLIDLDTKLDGGFQPSSLNIIGGRPAMGKTSLASNIAFNAAKNGPPVLFFSLEMAEEEILRRLMASELGLSCKKIKTGNLNSEELEKLNSLKDFMKSIPFHIDDRPGLTIPTIRNQARRFKRQHNIEMIVIDHLGIINSQIQTENRTLEISRFTRSLKEMAKELGVPVIVLSQLSRGVEERDNKRPRLSDLRDSGSIEQDADIVMFVYREKYYEDQKQSEAKNKLFEQKPKEQKQNALEETEIIIAKHRDGECGTVKVLFNPETTKIRNAQR